MNKNFIVVDGIDGSGKTTLCRSLVQRFTDLGYAVESVKDPSYYQERFRSVADPIERLLLHAASRRRLWNTIIDPALSAGRIVVCDRWVNSTIAYQQYGMRLSENMVQAIAGYSVLGMDDPAYFWLHINPLVAMQRIKERSCNNQLDRQSYDFYERVGQGYLHNLTGIGLDGTLPTDVLTAQVMYWLEVDG